MAIGTSDIKWLQSERLTDFDDGGGNRTGNEVVDGEVNNLFPDISSLDRTIGFVNLRKAFLSILTPNDDTYHGAGAILINPALHPEVHCSMIRATSPGDERAALRNRVESYRVRGPVSRWKLYGDHLEGQGTIQLWGLTETATFDIGEVIVLSIESDEFTDAEQYVRISNIISRAPQTFIDEQGAYRRDVLVVEIGTSLRQDFPGTSVTRTTGDSGPTKIRVTNVADAARYHSVKPITEPVAEGDLSIKVDSPFTPLVPATQAESPISGERAGLGRQVYEPAGAAGLLTFSGAVSVGSSDVTRYLGGPFQPGSLDITIDGTEYTDNGSGDLFQAGNDPIGELDYETGAITVFAGGPSGTWNASATPAAVTTPAPHSEQVPVLDQTRALNYVRTLRPRPAPGTLTIDYRALNNWVRLFDRGDGTISGDASGEGSGTIDYATGSVTVTLAALPDVDTVIIYTWATPVDVSRRDGDAEIDNPEISYTLANSGIEPGTVTITYTSGAVEQTLTDTDADGVLKDGGGTARGRILYGTGELAFTPADLPDPGTNIIFDYDAGGTLQESYNPAADGAGLVSFTLDNAPARPGSVGLEWVGEHTHQKFYMTRKAFVVDDGAGGFIYALPGPTGYNTGDPVVGASINYTTGEIDLPTTMAHKTPNGTFDSRVCEPRFSDFSGKPWNQAYISQWTYAEDATFTYSQTAGITAFYKEDAVGDTTEQETIEAPALTLNLAPLIAEPLVPGSIRFKLNGRTYVDRAGTLVYGVSQTTNAGTSAGSVDYANGTAKITDWVAGGNSVTIEAAASIFGQQPVSFLSFRTPGSPVRQGSMTMEALTYEDSTELIETADVNGRFGGSLIDGHIDHETGLVEVAFGERVTAAGNEGEWWYDEDAVDGDGLIWKPEPILPSSALFSAVVFHYIPIDADLLGLDPVRLPQDGRVPVFRKGGVAVVHRSTETEDADPTPGDSVNLNLQHVKWLRVRDANDEPIPDSKYTLDEVNGVLTWANPLDLSAYTTPITIDAMAYFQRVISDVQVNGRISINKVAPQAFPADGNTYVSSKLIASPQNLQARYTNLFSQESWTGEWSDELIGNTTTAQYDDVNNPFIMVNDGAETERWRIQFTNSTTVNVIGERYGQVLTGKAINETIAPVNPATGKPFFTIEPDGWGGGWETGNVLRFNTLGALEAIWFVRAILAGDENDVPDDRFIAQIQGDAS